MMNLTATADMLPSALLGADKPAIVINSEALGLSRNDCAWRVLANGCDNEADIDEQSY